LLLAVEDLKISFRLPEKRRLEALKGVSFFIDKGEIYCMLGESGSGKSVTAKSIIRLLPPQAHVEGRVCFKGSDLLSLPEREMRGIRGKEITIIFQEPMTSLNPTMKIGEQVAEVLMVHEGLSKREALERVVALFRELMIPQPEDRIHAYPHMLSGGMRQRVMIAMALISNPSLVLADEPTTALDVTVQAQILTLMKRLVKGKGTSLFFVTHDFGVASDMADRIGVLYKGVLVEEGTVEEIMSKPSHPYTIDLIKAIPTPKKGKFDIPLLSDEGETGTGCPYFSRCVRRDELCAVEMPQWLHLTPTHRVKCFNVD